MKTPVSLIIGLLFACCSKEDPKSELEIYADRFFAEAGMRGLDLDRSQLALHFIADQEAYPYTFGWTKDPPVVQVGEHTWSRYADAQKEIGMFHALGAAILRRTATNEFLPNCIDYKSLMLEGELFLPYNDVNSDRRKYYVDELFEPDTPTPSWGGTLASNANTIATTGEWQFYAVNGSNHAGAIIESDQSMNIYSGSNKRGYAYWQLSVPSDNIPVGSTIRITYDVRAIDVTAPGAFVLMQGIGTKDFTTSTRAYHPIIGNTNGFETRELILNCYPYQKPSLLISVGLEGPATGSVFFNNIKVEYLN